MATTGKTYTENFADKGSALNLYSNDPSHFSIVNNSDAIAGKSLELNYTNSSNGCVYCNGLKGMLVAGATYQVTVDYKVLTDQMPTGFFIGVTRDAFQNQKNIQLSFAGEQKNTVYTYTGVYTLDNFSDFYLQIFNMNAKDGSIIVIDNLKIVRTDAVDVTPETASDGSTLSDLATTGKTYTENFADKGSALSLSSYDPSHYSIVNNADAIAGKSLELNYTNTSNGCVYCNGLKGMLVAGATYQVTVDYKVLTDQMPTSFFIGVTRDAFQNQKNIQLNFAGKQKNTVYTYTGVYALDNFSDFYLQFFNMNGKDGSIIVIDNLRIVRTDIQDVIPETPSDGSTLNNLATINLPYTENFADSGTALNLFSYDPSHYSIINDTTAIAGKSLEMNYTNASNGSIYCLATKGKLVAGATYQISVSYKILTDQMPTDFFFGFTRDGAQNQINKQLNFTGCQKNTVYTYTDDFTLGNYSDYYLQFFNINGEDGSIMVIDNLSITRIT